ncbi:hypothetical protein MTO96_011716 [Rhipicephalus appendiculatus]
MMQPARSLRNDPRFGLDSTRSWVITAFLSFVMAMMMVGQQAAGVFFYGIVQTFNVSRQQASWPIVLTTTMTALSGTAVGGVFVGANVLVSQYFERRRATATSLVFTLSGVNMVFVPYLAELCRSTYGIQGAFLLLGAAMLNAFPPVFTLRSPEWLRRETARTIRDRNDANDQKLAGSSSNHSPVHNGLQNLSSNDGKEVDVNNTDVKLTEALFEKQMRLLQSRKHQTDYLQTNHMPKQSSQSVLKNFATVKFVVIALSFSVIAFGMATFLMLAVDLATDRGVAPSKAVLLLNAFAAADIIMRPTSGLVVDFKILSLEGVIFLGFLLQFLACELLALLKTLPLMLVSAVIYGVSNGSRFTLLAPCLVKDFGVEALPIMMGVVNFCNGLALLTRPLLVGYWRDTVKTYDGLLHFMAGVNAVFAAMWIIQIYVKRREKPPLDIVT